jgi:CheY-like chemotaxis protein
VYEQRRQHERAPLALSATAFRDRARLGSFRVVNLSAGGALFRGTRPVPVGEQVDLSISLPTGEFVRTRGVVLREGRLHERPIFAVAFAGISAADRRAVQELVAAVLEQMRQAYVLFIDGSEAACRALCEKARRCGFPSFAVTTALEALHLLDAGVKFRSVFVSLYLGGDDGREVLRHLEAKCPGVRRVLMSAALTRFDLMEASGAMTVGAPHGLLAGQCSDSDFKLAIVG